MAYFTQVDLENALSKAIVKAAYDDDHDNIADTDPIAACLAYGSAECDSFLRNTLVGDVGITLPLTTVPDEVKFAALEFGIAYTIRRRPDVMKAINVESYTVYYNAAVEKMKRFAASIQRLPSTVGTHATVGADVYAADPEDDDPPESRWADMGDFS